MILEHSCVIGGKIYAAGTEVPDSEASRITNPALIGKSAAAKNARALAAEAKDAEAAAAADVLEAEAADDDAKAQADADRPLSIPKVMEAVGDDVALATEALAAERQSDTPRSSLIEALVKVIDSADADGDEG